MAKSTSSIAKRTRTMPRFTRRVPGKQAQQLEISRQRTRPAATANTPIATSSKQAVANEARLSRLVARGVRRDEDARRIAEDRQISSTSIHFPNEIWLEIFSHMEYNTLKKLHLVSKRFCGILAARQFNSALFRPDEDDLSAELEAGTSRKTHPVIEDEVDYVDHGECMWTTCSARQKLCVQPDQAVCHDQKRNKELLRYREGLPTHLKQKWQSIARESAYWPPQLRETYVFGPFRHTQVFDDPDCKFITVAQCYDRDYSCREVAPLAKPRRHRKRFFY